MNKEEKKTMRMGVLALFVLLFLAVLPFAQQRSQMPTGAITGNSYVYMQCLKEYGKDIYGQWDWEKINACREYYKTIEKGSDAAIPRLCLSSPQRQECQDDE